MTCKYCPTESIIKCNCCDNRYCNVCLNNYVITILERCSSKIKCLDCDFVFSDKNLAIFLPEETFNKYLEIVQENLLKDNLFIREKDNLCDTIRKTFSELLNAKCPVCKDVWYDSDACMYVTCNKCSTQFCGFCLCVCDQEHVYNCDNNFDKGNPFCSLENLEKVQFKRSEKTIDIYIKCLQEIYDKKTMNMIYDIGIIKDYYKSLNTRHLINILKSTSDIETKIKKIILYYKKYEDEDINNLMIDKQNILEHLFLSGDIIDYDIILDLIIEKKIDFHKLVNTDLLMKLFDKMFVIEIKPLYMTFYKTLFEIIDFNLLNHKHLYNLYKNNLINDLFTEEYLNKKIQGIVIFIPDILKTEYSLKLNEKNNVKHFNDLIFANFFVYSILYHDYNYHDYDQVKHLFEIFKNINYENVLDKLISLKNKDNLIFESLFKKKNFNFVIAFIKKIYQEVGNIFIDKIIKLINNYKTLEHIFDEYVDKYKLCLSLESINIFCDYFGIYELNLETYTKSFITDNLMPLLNIPNDLEDLNDKKKSYIFLLNLIYKLELFDKINVFFMESLHLYKEYLYFCINNDILISYNINNNILYKILNANFNLELTLDKIYSLNNKVMYGSDTRIYLIDKYIEKKMNICKDNYMIDNNKLKDADDYPDPNPDPNPSKRMKFE